jgi:predicted membrane GTPase involved in stress response
MNNLDEKSDNMKALFDVILKHVPEAPDHSDKPFRMQVMNLAYDDYL